MSQLGDDLLEQLKQIYELIQGTKLIFTVGSKPEVEESYVIMKEEIEQRLAICRKNYYLLDEMDKTRVGFAVEAIVGELNGFKDFNRKFW